MTAPTFPGDAPPTPEVGPENTTAYLDQLAEDAAKAALPVDEDYEQARDDKGRFTKVSDLNNEEETADEEAAGDDAVAAEAEGEVADEATPTDTPASPIPVLDREPMVQMTVKVGETEISGLPDLTVTYMTPGGKMRTDPIDKVARLAADGIYSEQREQRFRQIEQQNAEAQEMLEQYRQRLDEREMYLEQLLADETRYVNEKDAWDRQNTPEMRLERERQKLEDERQQMEMSRIAQAGEQYFTNTLTPALEQIANAVPLVEPEELVAKVSLYVRSLEGRRGYLMPDQYAQVGEYLVSEVGPWAKALQERRSEMWTSKQETEAKAKQAEAAKAEAAKATVQSQKAKAQVAKAAKPVGQRTAMAPKSRPAPSSIDDLMDDAVQSAIDSVLGA